MIKKFMKIMMDTGQLQVKVINSIEVGNMCFYVFIMGLKLTKSF